MRSSIALVVHVSKQNCHVGMTDLHVALELQVADPPVNLGVVMNFHSLQSIVL